MQFKNTIFYEVLNVPASFFGVFIIILSVWGSMAGKGGGRGGGGKVDKTIIPLALVGCQIVIAHCVMCLAGYLPLVEQMLNICHLNALRDNY